MSTLYYEWGKVPNSSSGGGGGGTPSSGPPECFSGALAGVTVIGFTNSTITVTVRNTHDTASLDYSFDGGVTWFTLQHYDTTHESIKITSMQLRPTAGGNPTYEIVAALTP